MRELQAAELLVRILTRAEGRLHGTTPDSGEVADARQPLALPNGDGVRATLLEEALLALCMLCNANGHAQDDVRSAGGIPPLVRLLSVDAEQPTSAALYAAAVLLNLATANRRNQDAIREADGIAPLVAMLRHIASAEGMEAAERAAAALCNLAYDNDANQRAIRQAGAIEPLVALLRVGGVSHAPEHAAGALWALAFGSADAREEIPAAGAIAPLVKLKMLSTSTELAVQNAAGALQNLSMHSAQNADLIRTAERHVSVPMAQRRPGTASSPMASRAAEGVGTSAEQQASSGREELGSGLDVLSRSSRGSTPRGATQRTTPRKMR
eukprot:1233313-Prymnesium_polylepis.1